MLNDQTKRQIRAAILVGEISRLNQLELTKDVYMHELAVALSARTGMTLSAEVVENLLKEV